MRFLLLLILLLPLACTSDAPPMGPQVDCRDSLPVMATRGVSKLISDSGIVRYKIIAEEWLVYDKTQPQRQEFPKGVYLERYDDNASVNLHITADTAYCFDQYLWKLRGRVVMNDREKKVTYSSEELYWDMRKHIFYSNAPMTLQEPDRLIRGNWFESDEQMKQYKVGTTSGYMPVKTSSATPDSTAKDTVVTPAAQPTSTVKKVETKPALKPVSNDIKVPLKKATPLKTPAFDKQQRPTLNTGRVKAS
ncbi:MAG: LPS export ABC transporter periplasmic protein LptC [Bacteroidaceae bacterium]|nr:LPS export ABC transporter periplasmic protein LptC [Bacteroidaceae bacterium]